MRSILFILILSSHCLQSLGNINKAYISSKQGVTIFTEGGWDSVAEQRALDANLDFILDHINKPPGLNIFIILGAYGMHVQWRSKVPRIFITAAFDSLTHPDTMYSKSFDLSELNWGGIKQEYRPENYWHPYGSYPGDSEMAAPYLEGRQGLKISYYDIWDTVNYYNHLLSVVDYAVRHVEEIKKEQNRICLPAELHNWEISILTYDTAKLSAIPVTDWGFTFDPKFRHAKVKTPPKAINCRYKGCIYAIPMPVKQSSMQLLTVYPQEEINPLFFTSK